MARTGRRPGNQETREAILVAARQAFADRGFDRSSIRAIAAAAGVDPALVHHYFGTKEQLFLDVMQAPIDPATVVSGVLSGGAEGAGERLIRTVLSVWDSPAGGAAMAIIRSAVSNEAFARMTREFVVQRILRRIAKDLGVSSAEADLRTSLVATQIGGLILMRYIIRLEPLASAQPDVVAALVGPTIQRYLTGELPAGLGAGTGRGAPGVAERSATGGAAEPGGARGAAEPGRRGAGAASRHAPTVRENGPHDPRPRGRRAPET